VDSAITNSRSARFVVFSDREARSPIRDSESSNGQRMSWRVLAGNNRPLGRSMSTYDTFGECVAATDALRASAEQLKAAVTFDHKNVSWRWTLALDEVAVAVSVRSYARRIECTRALQQFIDIVETAPQVVDIRYVSSATR
jgi:hypothetical protein